MKTEILKNHSSLKKANLMRSILVALGLLFFATIHLPAQGSKSFVDGAHVHLELPKGSAKNKKNTTQARYNAPPGCVILSYRPIEVKRMGPCDYSFDFVAANSTFISSSEMSDAFSQAHSLAVSLGYLGEDLVALDASLNSMHSDYQAYQSQISASHQTLVNNASVQGAGTFNGGTTLDAYARIELLCVDPFMQGPEQLKVHLTDYVKKFPRKGTTNPDVIDLPDSGGEVAENSPFDFTSKPVLFGLGGLIILILIVIFILRKTSRKI
jgi:hypothetical protein